MLNLNKIIMKTMKMTNGSDVEFTFFLDENDVLVFDVKHKNIELAGIYPSKEDVNSMIKFLKDNYDKAME